MVRCTRALLCIISFLATGCGGEGSFHLNILFPDELSRTLVDRVELYVLQPAAASCEQLLAGELDPRALSPLASAQVTYPPEPDQPVWLPAVPAGAALFFAAARMGTGGELLRACAEVEVRAGERNEISLSLVWVCQPTGLEVPNNGQDDDCDGLTDECTGDAECDDDNGCTADLCLLEECHHSALSDGTACSDGDACTSGDACQAGACQGTARDCSEWGGLCQVGACDPATGQCGSVPADDDTTCDDGDTCTTDDTCQQGVCSGTAADCDDDDPCTADACDGLSGCTHEVQPNPGAEGPSGEPDSCSNNIDDDCDGLTDGEDPNCVSCSLQEDCDDGNPCTDDLCDAGNQCQNSRVPDGTACPDANACTTNETCQDGVCRTEARACPASICHVAGCNPSTGCTLTQVPTGTPCDDDEYCTSPDTCRSSGGCHGQDRDCGDADPCTVDSCSAAQESCLHVWQENPGAEGPPGAPSCSNDLDDDCDGYADDLDSDCSTCPRLVNGNLLSLGQQDADGGADGWSANPEVAVTVENMLGFNTLYFFKVEVVQAVSSVTLAPVGPGQAGGFNLPAGEGPYTWSLAIHGTPSDTRVFLDALVYTQGSPTALPDEVGQPVTTAWQQVSRTLDLPTNADELALSVRLSSLSSTLQVGDLFFLDFAVCRLGTEIPGPDCPATR